MTLQDEQHLSNTLAQVVEQKSTSNSINTKKKPGRPKGTRPKAPRKQLTVFQQREQELELKAESVVVKRAEYRRNIKPPTALDDFDVELATLKAQERAARFKRIVSGGDA